MDKIITKHMMVIMCGDGNGRLGSDLLGSTKSVNALYQTSNENGTSLFDFMQKNNLLHAASFRTHKWAHKYTWQHRATKKWFQIDHILCSTKYSRSLNDCRSYTSKHLHFSDHRILIAKFKLRLTAPTSQVSKSKPRFNWFHRDLDFFSRISEKLSFYWTATNGFLSKTDSLKWLTWAESVIGQVLPEIESEIREENSENYPNFDKPDLPNSSRDASDAQVHDPVRKKKLHVSADDQGTCSIDGKCGDSCIRLKRVRKRSVTNAVCGDLVRDANDVNKNFASCAASCDTLTDDDNDEVLFEEIVSTCDGDLRDTREGNSTTVCGGLSCVYDVNCDKVCNGDFSGDTEGGNYEDVCNDTFGKLCKGTGLTDMCAEKTITNCDGDGDNMCGTDVGDTVMCRNGFFGDTCDGTREMCDFGETGKDDINDTCDNFCNSGDGNTTTTQDDVIRQNNVQHAKTGSLFFEPTNQGYETTKQKFRQKVDEIVSIINDKNIRHGNASFYWKATFSLRDSLVKKNSNYQETYSARTWLKHYEDLFRSFEAGAHDFERFANKFVLPPNAAVSQFTAPKIEQIFLAINQLKNRKSTGSFLPAIFYKCAFLLKAVLADSISYVFKKMTEENNFEDDFTWLPKDLFKNSLVSIPKPGEKSIENSRPLALKRPFCKVIHGLIRDFIYGIVLEKLESSVTGFVPGKGTRDATFLVRQTIAFAIQSNTPLVLVFIDFTKAFTAVKRQFLKGAMRFFGIDLRIIDLIMTMMEMEELVINIHGDICLVSMQTGIAMGCNLAPLLFVLVVVYLMAITKLNFVGSLGKVLIPEPARENSRQMGVKVSDTEYADDMTLLDESAENIFKFLKIFEAVFSSAGLKLNKKKTKIMYLNCDLPEELKMYEMVDHFKLLGSIISKDGSCKVELKHRRKNAWIAYNVLAKVWKQTEIKATEKILILNSLVMSIFLYGLEITPLTVNQVNDINSFQRRLIRCCLKLPRRSNITFEYVPADRIIAAKALGYVGHLIRSENKLYNELLFPTFRGIFNMKKGRPLTTLADTISRYLVGTHDKNYKLQTKDIVNMAKNREFWSNTIKEFQSY